MHGANATHHFEARSKRRGVSGALGTRVVTSIGRRMLAARMMRKGYAFALVLLAAVTGPAQGAASYPRMAPLAWYLATDRRAEITLAQSAAPSAISLHATVLVLGRDGYETAQKGTNGFTCLVERSWMSPFSSSQFWNWHMRGPICYNPPASRTVLVYTLRRTDMAISGLTKSQMLDRIETAVANGQLPAPEPGSMSYMMSRHGYLGDGVGPWMSHLMFYAPKADEAKDGASWGADLPGSPVVFDTEHRIVPEPETIFMVPVSLWSDGTSAPLLHA
jgi:hypothetical protein